MANSTWIFPKRTTKNYMLASAGIAKIKLAVLVDVFQTTQSLVNSRCCFAEEERNAQRFISIMKAVLVRHTKHVFFFKIPLQLQVCHKFTHISTSRQKKILVSKLPASQ